VIDVVFIQGAGVGAHDEDALLAASLGRHLGDDFSVEYPRMPDEDEPDDERWHQAIGESIDRASGSVVLVGHSIGGYLLLTYLASTRIGIPVAAICIIAAPFPGGDPAWTFEGFGLPDHLADRLPNAAAVLLYAGEDDDIVPFAHRSLYAAAIPGATTRTTSGGHQLGEDLRMVADDIRRIVAEP
jgi:predicted alpha/beta hydrolase family esterase